MPVIRFISPSFPFLRFIQPPQKNIAKRLPTLWLLQLKNSERMLPIKKWTYLWWREADRILTWSFSALIDSISSSSWSCFKQKKNHKKQKLNGWRLSFRMGPPSLAWRWSTDYGMCNVYRTVHMNATNMHCLVPNRMVCSILSLTEQEPQHIPTMKWKGLL